MSASQKTILNNKYPFEVWVSTIAAAPVLLILISLLVQIFSLNLDTNLILLVPVFGYSVLFSIPVLLAVIVMFHLLGKTSLSILQKKLLVAVVGCFGISLLFFLCFQALSTSFTDTSFLVYVSVYNSCFLSLCLLYNWSKKFVD